MLRQEHCLWRDACEGPLDDSRLARDDNGADAIQEKVTTISARLSDGCPDCDSQSASRVSEDLPGRDPLSQDAHGCGKGISKVSPDQGHGERRPENDRRGSLLSGEDQEPDDKEVREFG